MAPGSGRPRTTFGIPAVPNPYYDETLNLRSVLVRVYCEPPFTPGTPNVSWGAEAFLDTPVVNGTAYPTLTVDPKAYRFRILNAAHDRFWNLQLYKADPAVSVGTAGLTEVKMVPAIVPTGGLPGGLADGRKRGRRARSDLDGGPQLRPDRHRERLPARSRWWSPTSRSPGTRTRPRSMPATLICMQLLLGPAERADVIVDFSAFAGQTLILYNDAPAAFPALDPRLDYYTGAPDLTGHRRRGHARWRATAPTPVPSCRSR